VSLNYDDNTHFLLRLFFDNAKKLTGEPKKKMQPTKPSTGNSHKEQHLRTSATICYQRFSFKLSYLFILSFTFCFSSLANPTVRFRSYWPCILHGK